MKPAHQDIAMGLWLVVIGLVLLLTACGGNGDDDDTSSTPTPPNCQLQPELCK